MTVGLCPAPQTPLVEVFASPRVSLVDEVKIYGVTVFDPTHADAAPGSLDEYLDAATAHALKVCVELGAVDGNDCTGQDHLAQAKTVHERLGDQWYAADLDEPFRKCVKGPRHYHSGAEQDWCWDDAGALDRCVTTTATYATAVHGYGARVHPIESWPDPHDTPRLIEFWQKLHAAEPCERYVLDLNWYAVDNNAPTRAWWQRLLGLGRGKVERYYQEVTRDLHLIASAVHGLGAEFAVIIGSPIIPGYYYGTQDRSFLRSAREQLRRLPVTPDRYLVQSWEPPREENGVKDWPAVEVLYDVAEAICAD